MDTCRAPVPPWRMAPAGTGPDGDTRLDTVGVVCIDAAGRGAAVVSSGGVSMKKAFRVGQAALLGSG
eukprot:m.245238 g.245238  ORF g.245238 m.245238 type:complete len:67 (-) comp19478_c0_seq17:2152-2352(-)